MPQGTEAPREPPLDCAETAYRAPTPQSRSSPNAAAAAYPAVTPHAAGQRERMQPRGGDALTTNPKAPLQRCFRPTECTPPRAHAHYSTLLFALPEQRERHAYVPPVSTFLTGPASPLQVQSRAQVP